MSEQVVVAGAGFAGLNAALALDNEGFDVILIDKSREHVFQPGLIELIRGRVSEDDLSLDIDDFLRDTEIEYTCEEIESFDPGNKVVHAEIGNYDYDYLVVALGSECAEPEFSLNYTEDFYNLENAGKAVDASEDAKTAIVIGSGYTGVEVATEFHEKGLDVTIVEQATRPMPEADEQVSQTVLDHLNSKEISFRGGNKVEVVTNYGVELEDGSEIKSDMVVWCGGLEASKTVQKPFNTGKKGIKVNSGLSAEDYQDVFVAGDSADDGFMDTAQIAEKQGLFISKNIRKDSDEMLEDFDTKRNPLLVSLGSTGMLITGSSVYTSRIFRKMKDFVIKKYFRDLKKRKKGSRFSVKSYLSFTDKF